MEDQDFVVHVKGGYRWSDLDRWVTLDGPITRDRKIVGRIMGDDPVWAYQIAAKPYDLPQVPGFATSREAFDAFVERHRPMMATDI